MTKLIATIDLVRGIASEGSEPVDIPSVTRYQENKIKAGGFISNPEKFDELINSASELHITQLSTEVHSRKQFPHFEHAFKLVKRGAIKRENGFEYQNQIWKRI